MINGPESDQMPLNRKGGRMKHLILACALTPVFAYAAAASAETSAVTAKTSVRADLAKVDADYKDCLNKASSNTDMKECAYGAHQRADGILNKAYNGYVKVLRKKTGDSETDKYQAETLRRLTLSEKAWVAFRDADCDLQATTMLFGSGESLIYGGCLYDQTVRRANVLEDLFNPEERH
jgi:uncharacterized protein YecT (DUF1311 family)